MELLLLVIYKLGITCLACYMTVNYHWTWIFLLVLVFVDFTLYYGGKKKNVKRTSSK